MLLDDAYQEAELYDVYLNAICKDGVPYTLLQKVLPVIESEVNTILNQLVNFTVKMDTDEKNNINCHLTYDDSNIWPVELASGMERFVVSIATRVALINITSLPRPNFLAIDEGFGVLDSDNLNSLYQLFEYLKTQFDFILIITHIDAMKDFVDDMIFIVKEPSGFSQLGQK
jgi:DNA repair exonuclease SbcCD ATPase subunit